MDEGEIPDLIIKGSIPKWLNGSLVRNGPAEFNFSHQMLHHWFDGMAKIHAIKFTKGKPTYIRRLIQSQEFINSNKNGKIFRDQFGTNSKHPVLNKTVSLIYPRLSDNSGVNIIKYGKKYLTLSETVNSRIALNSNNLKTIGPFKFQDSIKEHLSTGHFLYDIKAKEFYGYSIKLGLISMAGPP